MRTFSYKFIVFIYKSITFAKEIINSISQCILSPLNSSLAYSYCQYSSSPLLPYPPSAYA